jgi:UDP-3-O-[3-hydroxymyristoyl] N-acetylglucosamine deacetylase
MVDGRSFPAVAASVASTQRCTVLQSADGRARVSTVEHVLSALHGLQVDNALIGVDGPEIPILDGSALPWVEALLAAGIAPLAEPVEFLTLRETVALRDGDSWLVAEPADQFRVTCVIDFDHPLIGTQAETFVGDPHTFAREIAPARTFGFLAEVEALRAAGLALGGSLDNALIIHDDHFSSPFRVPNELLRHKLLDLWGDLALAGGRLRAHVTAVKPGHRINAAFAALLAQKTTRSEDLKSGSTTNGET